MKISCLKCEEGYKPNPRNTKIYGVYIETTCPFCASVWEGKFLNFVEKQIGGLSDKPISDAARMQQLARFVEFNSSEYYKKKNRGKKRGR